MAGRSHTGVASVRIRSNSMTNTIDFVLERAQATCAVQTQMAGTWVWDEKTVAQWNTEIAAVIAQKEASEDAAADMKTARGSMDGGIDDLHTKTMQGLGIAKTKYRNDPAKLSVIQSLTASASSRTGILEEALNWESAWEKLDPAWEPLTGLTLASFKTLRTGCI